MDTVNQRQNLVQISSEKAGIRTNENEVHIGEEGILLELSQKALDGLVIRAVNENGG
jgi:hypothetical protein